MNLNPMPEFSDLHLQLDAHLEELVSGTEIEVIKILESILKGCFPERELLSKVMAIRNAHPKGLSIRRSKRRKVLDEIVELVRPAMTTERVKRKKAQFEASEQEAQRKHFEEKPLKESKIE